MSGFPFRDGQDVVATRSIDKDIIQGRRYRVVNCYSGTSGCGAQVWVRVLTELGKVTGYGPEVFVPYAGPGSVNEVACALAIRRRTEKLLEGLTGGGPFATLYNSLKDILEDADALISASAGQYSPPLPVAVTTDLDAGYLKHAHAIFYLNLDADWGEFSDIADAQNGPTRGFFFYGKRKDPATGGVMFAGPFSELAEIQVFKARWDAGEVNI